MKNRNFNNLEKLVQDYLSRSYYKTAALMAHSCRGVAIVSGMDQEKQEQCFRFGQHLG